ncbi:MAG: hypothetical protein GY744_06650 [Gammaproteobacteria bacterium]|nr:hypothetical protein [Gammaproteobacteria bacterium]
MTGSNILNNLDDFFDEKKKKQKKCKDDLLKLMEKLGKYRKKLKHELSSETKNKKIQQIKAELKIVKKKCMKATKLLESL